MMIGCASTSFALLLVFRAGVGVGEAALVPCALSIVQDVFPSHQHIRANGVFAMAPFIGTGIAYAVSGYIYSCVNVLRPFEFSVLIVPFSLSLFARRAPLSLFCVSGVARQVFTLPVVGELRGWGMIFAVLGAVGLVYPVSNFPCATARLSKPFQCVLRVCLCFSLFCNS